MSAAVWPKNKKVPAVYNVKGWKSLIPVDYKKVNRILMKKVSSILNKSIVITYGCRNTTVKKSFHNAPAI